MGAGGLKGFGGAAEEKADGERERREERERRWRGCVYQTMSWVPLCRQDGNYRAHMEKALLGREAEILKLLGCRPQHNRNQPILKRGPWEEGSRSLHRGMVPRRRQPRPQTESTSGQVGQRRPDHTGPSARLCKNWLHWVFSRLLWFKNYAKLKRHFKKKHTKQ